MQKPNNQKLKTYTALALALSLASPISALATGEDTKTQDTLTSASESILALDKEETKPYTSNVSPTLSEDGTKISYEVSLEKSTEDPANVSAHIFLPRSSKIESIKVITDEEEEADQKVSEDTPQLDITLPRDTTNFKLEANLKEKAREDLIFDLAILDNDQGFIEANRIAYNIKEENDTKTLAKIKSNDIISNISGKFISADQIEWSGYLVNPSDEDKDVKHELKLSDSQDIEGSLLTIKRYTLDENGKLVLNEENLALGSIKTTLGPNDYLSFSFTTQAKEGQTEFTVNEATVTRDIEADETDDKATDSSEAEQAQESKEEKLDQTETKEADQTPAPSEDKENQTPDLDKIEENEARSQVEKSIKELQEGSDEIENLLEEAGVDLSDLETSDDSPAEEQTSNEEAPVETPDQDQASIEADESDDTEEESEENLQVAESEEVQAPKIDKEVDFDKLTKEINDANQEIIDLLKANGIVSPIVIDTQKPLAKSKSSTSSLDIDKLIKDIVDATVEIEDLARQIYGDSAYESAIALHTKDKEKDLDKLVTDIEEANSEIVATLAQAFKAEDASYTDEDIKELVAILDKLENLKDNSKKATSDESKSLEDLSQGLGKASSKDIGEVKTVTLDPLDDDTIKDLTKNIENPIFKNKAVQILNEAGL